MDFGGFDSFGGSKPGGHRPATVGERAVVVWLARLAALLLTAVGFGGALLINDPDRFRAFLVVGCLGVISLLILWIARRLDLI